MKRLQKKREQVKMSRSQVATLMGVATNTVWRWEAGEREPSLGLIQKLAGLFNCTIDELVGDDNNENLTPPAQDQKNS